MANVKITYYLEVLSSWCCYVEPVWAELQQAYAGRVDFAWKIALMNRDDFPVSTAQCEWFYRRSGTLMRRPARLNSGWFEARRAGDYTAPNLVAEAGRDFGLTDDRLRLALSQAALQDGCQIGDLATAIACAAKPFGLDPRRLRRTTESKAVADRVAASTAEFHAHQINQRPAFVLTDAIGDKAVFSGLLAIGPLRATLDAMLADGAAYESWTAHFGPPPAR
ncbi:MAG: DsbA family protein [Opitutales bacterium]